MYKIIAMIILLAICACGLRAQGPGSITPAVLEELERSCVPDAQLRAAQHTLAQVDGNKITQNWEKIIGVDSYFSLRLKDQKITDQKQTGRCWMFSGLNIIRPIVTNKLNTEDVELSQNYLYFYEKLEKANLFLEGIIRTSDKPYTDRTVEYLLKQNVQDGQNWLGFVEAREEIWGCTEKRHAGDVQFLQLGSCEPCPQSEAQTGGDEDPA